MSEVEKTRDDSEIKQLRSWVTSLAKEQSPKRLEILNEIFKAATKLAKESPGTLNLKIAATTLKELRYSFKMFFPYRFTQKITVFGSARVLPGEPLYEFAREFAQTAVGRNYMIITGGGPGVMAAGNEGAGAQGGFGLNIRLPFEQAANRFIDDKKRLIHYKYFFTRKLFLVKEASAFALFPGGFGTFDEAFELLTLLQSGKTNLIPMVLLEPKGFGFWEAFASFLRTAMVTRNFISDSDCHFFKVLHTPEAAVGHIDQFYRVYHSMRFVNERVVFRLKRTLSDGFLSELAQEFCDLSPQRDFVMSAPLPEELNEPELRELPRLIFTFERKDFGGLRRLIDFMNEKGV